MKKIFNKITKILLLVSMLTTQLLPSFTVFANTSASIDVKVSNDNLTYQSVLNNENYTFDHTNTITDYYYQLKGSNFEDADKLLVKADIEFYGVWDAETKFDSETYVDFTTGSELNTTGLSYTFAYDHLMASNGTYKINISTIKLSDITIGGVTLDTKLDAELEAMKSDIIAHDMSNYTKVTNNNFNLIVSNLPSGFKIDSVKNDLGTDLTLVEGAYEYDVTLATGVEVLFHYEVGNYNPQEEYHLNIYQNDIELMSYANGNLASLSNLSILGDNEFVNGIHELRVDLFDSKGLLESNTIKIKAINSPINDDLNTYFTLDDTIRNDFALLSPKITNYKALTEEEKNSLDASIKEEMDELSEKFNNILNDSIINQAYGNHLTIYVNSYMEVNGEEEKIMFGFDGSLDGVFDKESISVPQNIKVQDFITVLEAQFDQTYQQQSMFEFKITIYDEEGNVVSNEDYLQTGMRVEFDINSKKYDYYLILRGNLVTDDGMINEDDINEVISLGIGTSTLDNIYYLAADVDYDGQVDLLDVTEMLYILNNNNQDDDFVTYENNYVPQRQTDKVQISLLTNVSSVRVGDKFKVQLLVSGLTQDKISGLQGALDFDKTLLKVNSIQLNNNWIGNINVVNADNYGKFMYAGTEEIGEDKAILTINFEALSIGNAKIMVDKLKAALNGYEVVLENVESKTNALEVNIERQLSSGANIESLTFDKGSLAQPFNSNTLTHTIYVNYLTESITLGGKLSQYAITDGFKEYALPNWTTVIPITVVAEDGTTKTYTINVVKVDNRSSNANLKELQIEGYEIAFDKNTLEYEITVESNVNELDITAIAESSKATVEIYGDTNLKTGLNEIKIVVTSEKGNSKTYTLKVTKKAKEVVADEDNEEDNENSNGNSKLLLIIIIIAIILALLFLIFKDKDEKEPKEFKLEDKEKNKNNKE